MSDPNVKTSRVDPAVDTSETGIAELVDWARGQSNAIRPTANVTALALAACAVNLNALAQERDDAKSDATRLHKDKCDYLDALIACRIALKDDGNIGAALTIINKACPVHDR